MTTKNVRDFLDKELFVKRSIVTFRSLSRELGIHVNDAKNELRLYYDAVRETDAPAVPTYLVSGEIPSLTVGPRRETQSQQTESSMDVDLEFEEGQEEADVVCQSKVLLAEARTLEEATSQFSRVHSVHIYSLSPSRLCDAGLVCTPSFKVHRADAKGGLVSFSTTGKITGSHVKLKSCVTHQSAASSSKTTLDVPLRPEPKVVLTTKAEQQTVKGKNPSSETKAQAFNTAPLQKTETKDKLKPSGKLDWSKAKAKEKEPVAEKTKEEKKPKLEFDSVGTAKDSSSSKKSGPDSTKQLLSKSKLTGIADLDAPKRGIKRKPQTETDSESEPEPALVNTKPSFVTGSSVKNGMVYSDEDDDSEIRVPGQRRLKKKNTMTSDSETSLRAIMDIDDEQVDRVSRVSSKVLPRREEEEESSSEEPEKEATLPPATSEDEIDLVPVLPKKKQCKTVPIGHNGLKKRRVVKSRTTTDAKGYMHTEDYSSYESVEEDEKMETNTKRKGRETKKDSEPKVEEAKPKVVVKEESVGKPKAKAPKPRGGAPKRGGLLNFFGPDKK